MVGQSTKTFPSHPSSRRESGNAWRTAAGQNELCDPCQHGPAHPGRGAGFVWSCGFFFFCFAFFLVLPFSVVEVAAGNLWVRVCTQLPCHSAVTLHLLATEQKALRSFSGTVAALSRRSHPSKTGVTDRSSSEEKSVEWTVNGLSV